MEDFDEYEIRCKIIRQDNFNLLDEFIIWLRGKGLTEKTIQKHVNNIELYINHFLLYEDETEAKNGVSMVDMFLGYWFIKKAMWANVAQIKSNAGSLKKFYGFMCKKGQIKQEQLDDLNVLIKQGMPEWIATMERYDDPNIDDMEEVWGLPGFYR